VSEQPGKSHTELVIESFVDKMQEIQPELDREEFHEAISGYVQEYTQETEEVEESEEES
jgi:predicted solute-binding protein